MKKLVLLLCLIASTVPLIGQIQQLRIGQQAPPLSLEELLQSPVDVPLSWIQFRGNSMVIDFWGTWCGPCIQALPHMNRLALEFKEKPIHFLAVTDEDRETVERFLKTRPIEGWVGLDTDGSMFSNYGVISVPFTVLIDSNGIVQDVTHPFDVDSNKIDALIENRLRMNPDRPLTNVAARTLVVPSERTSAIRRDGKDGAMELLGYSFIQLVSAIYEFPISRIRMNITPPERRFDVLMPGGQGPVGILVLKKVLETSVGFQSSESVVDMEVMVLSKMDGPGIPEDDDHNHVYPASWENGVLQANTTTELASQIEGHFGQPVVNETGVIGRFPVRIEADGDDLEKKLAAVGLKIESRSRKVRILGINPP